MQYLMLIYTQENEREKWDKEKGAEILKGYWDFNQEVTSDGVMLAGEALHPTKTAVSVRVQDGKMLATDGPFAETKEQLGGFYLLECKDLEEAKAYAAKIPAAAHGVVEIRPIMTAQELGMT